MNYIAKAFGLKFLKHYYGSYMAHSWHSFRNNLPVYILFFLLYIKEEKKK